MAIPTRSSSLIPFGSTSLLGRRGWLEDPWFDSVFGDDVFRGSSLFDQFRSSHSGDLNVSVSETNEAVFLEMEVPRFRSEDIKVSNLSHGRISIEGRLPSRAQETRGRTLFADSPLHSFNRTFSFPTSAFDTEKLSFVVEHGVLTVCVPRVTKPEPKEPETLSIQSGAPAATPQLAAAPNDAHNNNSQVATTPTTEQQQQQGVVTAPAEWQAIRKLRWPPQIQVEDTADHLSYACEVPPAVSKEHLSLKLDGDRIVLGVTCAHSMERKNNQGAVTYHESSSVGYSTGLAVPPGTSSKDISSSYENGRLIIKVAKHKSQK